MIKRDDCFVGRCNVCNNMFESVEGWCLFIDESTLAESMWDKDWHLDGSDCYCPDCHEIDDEDNLIIKQKL
jgi:hypothetical protein